MAARQRTKAAGRAGAMPELRVYLMLEGLQRQFAAYLSSPVPARGYVPLEGMHSLIVEVAPGLAIERVIDLALKSVPSLEPGILAVERQFGVLELHSEDREALDRGGRAILEWLGAKPEDQLKPRLLFSDIIEDVTDQHAVIVNRSRQANMILPGQSLLLIECVPALFAAFIANEAERAEPAISLVECRMIGASGRLYMAGEADALRAVLDRVGKAVGALPGRTA